MRPPVKEGMRLFVLKCGFTFDSAFVMKGISSRLLSLFAIVRVDYVPNN